MFKRKRIEETPLESLERILKEMNEMEGENCFQAFAAPVSLDVPAYYDVVKKPMDFGTIQNKFDSDEYEDVDSAIEDISLVWRNCFFYNSSQFVEEANIGWIIGDALNLQYLLFNFMKASGAFTETQIFMAVKPQPSAVQRALAKSYANKSFPPVIPGCQGDEEDEMDEEDDSDDSGETDETNEAGGKDEDLKFGWNNEEVYWKDEKINRNDEEFGRNDEEFGGNDEEVDRDSKEVDGDNDDTNNNTPDNNENDSNKDDGSSDLVKSAFPAKAPDLDTLLGDEMPGDRDVLSDEELDFIMNTLAVVPSKCVDSVIAYVQRASPHTVAIATGNRAIIDISLFDARVQRWLLKYLKDCKKALDSRKKKKK